MELNGQINLTVNYLVETWNALTQRVLQHPEHLLKTQVNYWQDYQALHQDLANNLEVGTDKRFQHDEWQQNAALNNIKQSYLLLTKHIDELIENIAEKDEKTAKKLHFFTRQFLNAISPSNFATINPEVLARISETQGINLITGFKQLLEDIERGNGQLNIKMGDFDSYKLGENIACTPGKIIFQNDLMQLIQYTATTEKIFQIPLLIIPPWINKYYILDLQKENSFVKWLVDQGITVFMISWVNPTKTHKMKKFSDYMRQGPLAALKVIKKITGQKQTNLLGYCIGGTLLACLLAYLAKKNDERVRSATFLTTLLDFSEPGELGTFIDEEQLSLLEKYMKLNGYLDGSIMASVFNALRSNDLIWSSFINNYLKGQKPKPSDLLFWNADSTNIPEKVHSFYLRNTYLNNDLIQANKVKMAGRPINLGDINTPSYFLAAHDDHIVPWTSCYRSCQYLSGPVKFVLTSSGHVAGVINPPHKKKYGYWVHNKKPKHPEKYLENAHFHKGSWWQNWGEWLEQYLGKLRPINSLKTHATDIIENAPGSYVKIRLTDIAAAEITTAQKEKTT